MPDSKDIGGKPWQPVYLARRKHTDDPLRQMPEVAARASSVHEGEIYVPLQVIKERLTDKHIAAAAAKAEFESVESYKWSSCSPSEKDEWRAGYLRAIEAALDAAFSKEEGS